MTKKRESNSHLPDQFRQLLRRFASTVTIITTGELDNRWGLVATAVMPVALTPPSLVVSINRVSSSHDALKRMGRFCINVLSDKLANLSREFSARPRKLRFDPDKWNCCSEFLLDFRGIPYLAGAQSVILCSAGQSVECGTHTVFFATVMAARRLDLSRPLLYLDGDYVTTGPLSTTRQTTDAPELDYAINRRHFRG